jgi:TPR repeat protein
MATPLLDAMLADARNQYPEAARLFQPLAEAGHPHAQFRLGVILADGLAGVREAERGLNWIDRAAEQGYAPAALFAANARLLGQRGEAREAVPLLQRAAASGLGDALMQLGLLHASGQHVNEDNARALELLQQAVAKGSVRGQLMLGRALVTGLGGKLELVRGSELLREARRCGAADAEPVLLKVRSILERQAQHGDAAAAGEAGQLWLDGPGETSEAEGERLLRIAAAEHQTTPAFRLGALLLDRDPAEAARWLRAAAANGHDGAALLLAGALERGQVAPGDPGERAQLLRGAAERGDPAGQRRLATLLAAGSPAQRAEAPDWLRRAAEGGDAAARLELGLRFRDGDGLPADAALAARWLIAAHDAGAPNAAEELRPLLQKLSWPELERATAWARSDARWLAAVLEAPRKDAVP